MKIKVMGACGNAGRIINAVREVSRGACHLPHPAVRLQAALHCAPPCYGPLPRGCRGALGAPPAEGAGRRAAGVAAPKGLLFFLSVLCGLAVWSCTLFTRLGHRHHHGVPTDDTPHPVHPIVSCMAASRNLFLPHTVLLDMPPPQRRKFHTQWARNNTQ